MIHLNEVWKQNGPLWQLGELFQPQVYLAASISNFLNERQNVHPTNFFRASFQETSHLYGKSIIHLHDVKYWRLSSDRALLEDINELEMGIMSPPNLDRLVEHQRINDGDRVQRAIIIYQKDKDEGLLYSLEKYINKQKPEFVPRPLYNLVPSF